MQGNGEDQKHHNRRAWLRWAVASAVGGVVSVCTVVYGTILMLIAPASPSQQTDVFNAGPLFIAFLSMAFAGGALGGLTHWLLVGRPLEQGGSWVKKWMWTFVSSLIVVAPVSFNIVYVKQALIQFLLWASVGSVVGLALAWVLRDTRPTPPDDKPKWRKRAWYD